MDQLLDQFFNIPIMMKTFPLLLKGLWMTAKVCAIVIPVGAFAGLVVALCATSQSRLARILTVPYVDLFRAVPPLVLLIFIHSGLPFAGISLSPFQSVTLAFLLNNSAFYGEIYRAGLGSIGAGQREAARSTGLTALQTNIYVVIPQAVRNVLPDLLSNTIEVVKLTSLASVVALPELLYSADMARSITFNASPLVLAAAFYLVLLWPVVRLLSRLERRVAA